jgi:hypothetical protein
MARKPPLAVEKFGGMIPILDDRALPDQFASLSENVALYGQVLQGFNIPKAVYTMKDPSKQYAFRIPNDYNHTKLYDPSTWMEFTSPDTCVIHTPTVDDQFDRYYWVEPGSAPMYNTAARIRAGQPPYLLGIPTPAVAPGVTSSGGSGAVFVARSYVYTWVSAFSEEGPPSPYGLHNGQEDDTWYLTLTAPTAAQTAGRNLTNTNIYRTITSTNGVATYFYVGQVPISQLTFTDGWGDDIVSGNNQLQSTDWGSPPTTLKGMVSMPNGIILGWDGTDVLFCEPYRPHAWPSAYGLTTDYNVVGAGVYGQSGVLCTESVPHVVTGNHPAVMTMQKINVVEPCLSQGSIVAGTQGVYYASPNGLALVNPAGVSLITKQIIGTRIWLQLVDPNGLRAVRYSGVYMAFDCSKDLGQFGGIIDPTDQRVAFCRLSTPQPVDNVLVDLWSGRFVVLSGGVIYEFDPPDGTQQIVYSWKSKRFHAKKKTNFSTLKIYFDGIELNSQPDETTRALTRLGNPWSKSNREVLPADEPLRFRLWADDRLVYDQPLYNSGDQVSLPGGFKAEWWQFEVVAQVDCVSVHMGVDAKDLAQV